MIVRDRAGFARRGGRALGREGVKAGSSGIPIGL
jgi:hypothetical protein